MVLTYGDANSTLAAALAAVKIHIPVAHIESGLRSFNRRMPEEINRIITDMVSSLLFCPTTASVANLCDEGGHEGVCLVGDVVYDAALYYQAAYEHLCCPTCTPNSQWAAAHVLSLPMHPYMNESVQCDIVEAMCT